MREIFVFGSNRKGRHGAGSAFAAFQEHGAKWGIGEGLCGNSYAIPTKNEHIQTLYLKDISIHVERFLDFAEAHQDMKFNIVAIGCGLAGYTPEQIAPLFRNAPSNCVLPPGFKKVLAKEVENVG